MPFLAERKMAKELFMSRLLNLTRMEFELRGEVAIRITLSKDCEIFLF